MGRGGDQVVSVLAIYADDPSSNPAEAPSFDLMHPLLFRVGTRVSANCLNSLTICSSLLNSRLVDSE